MLGPYVIKLAFSVGAFAHEVPRRQPTYLKSNRYVIWGQKDVVPPDAVVMLSIAIFRRERYRRNSEVDAYSFLVLL